MDGTCLRAQRTVEEKTCRPYATRISTMPSSLTNDGRHTHTTRKLLQEERDKPGDKRRGTEEEKKQRHCKESVVGQQVHVRWPGIKMRATIQGGSAQVLMESVVLGNGILNLADDKPTFALLRTCGNGTEANN
jgi:hypothetical protein